MPTDAGQHHHHVGAYDADADPFVRRSAYLYGLIITGSVLAAAPEDLGLVRVAALLGGTLVVYWSAETYADCIAARTVLGRPLDAHERRRVLTDGFPLVAACAVPGVVLLAEAVLRVEPALAVDVALLVNVVLLMVVGWRMGTAGGLTGGKRALTTAAAGLLGVAMIGLKLVLHH
ncbi:hypothetical protein Bcav_4135 [Beutenbergia cavernae DSM 12333]|uniref:Integral membrane protein n=1 Tax=Beutenbergia cavernae (strain ATCC BAA-8 / DSM 12333 / CCUG 43141 / JCM 11478 / NBRC 16432 / NCIMB 13614 / HKI 0122) TaxID=471853 RepID=C5C617_BEUC1|nr:hypothetical protein [Beutenbergia cavernae]ACQ82375.1 hypothetical protein Bcav_4135 [Beutenbergia cavernae DSM 12333]